MAYITNAPKKSGPVINSRECLANRMESKKEWKNERPKEKRVGRIGYDFEFDLENSCLPCSCCQIGIGKKWLWTRTRHSISAIATKTECSGLTDEPTILISIPFAIYHYL